MNHRAIYRWAAIVAACGAWVVLCLWVLRPTRETGRADTLKAGETPATDEDQERDVLAPLIAAARCGDASAVDRLAKRADRSFAGETIAAETKAAICRALSSSDDPAVATTLYGVAVAIGISPPELAHITLDMMANSDTRCAGLAVAGQLPGDDPRIEDAISGIIVDELASSSQHPSWTMQHAERAVIARGKSTPYLVEALRRSLRRQVRRLPLAALKSIGPAAGDAAGDLRAIAAAGDEVPTALRESAVDAFAAVVGPETFASEVRALLQSDDTAVQVAALGALESGGQMSVALTSTVSELLRAPAIEVRAAAFRTLARWRAGIHGVEGVLAERLNSEWAGYVRGHGEGRYALEAYFNALGAYPVEGGLLVSIARTAATDADSVHVRWRAAYAYWRATGDTALGAKVVVNALETMGIGQKAVIPALAEMAFGEDRKSGANVLVRDALAASVGAMRAIEGCQADPRTGEDARALLELAR